jgi:hypothetical protein
LRWRHIKLTESALVKLENLWSKLWDYNNPHWKKIDKNHETQFPINPMLEDKIKKQIKFQKQIESTRVISLNSWYESW